MIREEIIKALQDDKMMPFIQPDQLVNIVDFVIENYKPSIPDGLDEAAENRVTENGRFPISEFEEMRISDIKFGAECMKAKMMEEAEETELYWDGDFLAIDLNMAALGYCERDKVKVIVIKEDEK